MILHNLFTLSDTTPTQVVGPATQRQVAHFHNATKSSNEYVYIGSQTVSTANSIHLDPGESKEITIEPLDTLWAVSDPDGLQLGVLIVRQSQ
jgi:hypothetical protein